MTVKQQVLNALRDAGPRGLTTVEITRPEVGGVRAAARIMELRREGHTITSTYVRKGSYRFTLDAEAGGGGSPPLAPVADLGAEKTSSEAGSGAGVQPGGQAAPDSPGQLFAVPDAKPVRHHYEDDAA